MKRINYLFLILLVTNICYADDLDSDNTEPTIESDTVILSATDYERLVSNNKEKSKIIKRQQQLIDKQQHAIFQRNLLLSEILLLLPAEQLQFPKDLEKYIFNIFIRIEQIKNAIRKITQTPRSE